MGKVLLAVTAAIVTTLTILSGSSCQSGTGNDEYLMLHQESQSFYNSGLEEYDQRELLGEDEDDGFLLQRLLKGGRGGGRGGSRSIGRSSARAGTASRLGINSRNNTKTSPTALLVGFSIVGGCCLFICLVIVCVKYCNKARENEKVKSWKAKQKMREEAEQACSINMGDMKIKTKGVKFESNKSSQDTSNSNRSVSSHDSFRGTPVLDRKPPAADEEKPNE